MIELRWVKRKVDVGFGDVILKDVLQYRRPGGKWKDVPNELVNE